MARFTRGLVVTLGVVFLGLLITMVPQKTASGQGGNSQPVIVKNTPLPTTVTNTVPVSGAVQITNTSLPVTGSLSGVITNPANNPVLVSNVNDSADRLFFFSLCEQDYSNPLACSGVVSYDPLQNQLLSFFTVPNTTASGATVTRAVIEFASGICHADATDDITELSIIGTFNNNFSPFALLKTPGTQRPFTPPQPSPTTWSWSNMTKIYAPPGASISLNVRSTGNPIGLEVCDAEFWGTLLTQ